MFIRDSAQAGRPPPLHTNKILSELHCGKLGQVPAAVAQTSNRISDQQDKRRAAAGEALHRTAARCQAGSYSLPRCHGTQSTHSRHSVVILLDADCEKAVLDDITEAVTIRIRFQLIKKVTISKVD